MNRDPLQKIFANIYNYMYFCGQLVYAGLMQHKIGDFLKCFFFLCLKIFEKKRRKKKLRKILQNPLFFIFFVKKKCNILILFFEL